MGRNHDEGRDINHVVLNGSCHVGGVTSSHPPVPPCHGVNDRVPQKPGGNRMWWAI